MSGFEIAGVVLGALPVIFACVDLPKQGARRSLLIFRKRVYIDKLARALLLQKQIIAENIKSLACAGGCDNVWLVDEDPVTYLNDEVVQDQILDYLGFENYTALSSVLGQSHDVLKGIAEKMQGLLPGGKVCEFPPNLDVSMRLLAIAHRGHRITYSKSSPRIAFPRGSPTSYHVSSLRLPSRISRALSRSWTKQPQTSIGSHGYYCPTDR